MLAIRDYSWIQISCGCSLVAGCSLLIAHCLLLTELACCEPSGLGARARAPESALNHSGESPLEANALRPETESNCGVARRGGEQLEVKQQSVG